jgi:hypothetical protein
VPRVEGPEIALSATFLGLKTVRWGPPLFERFRRLLISRSLLFVISLVRMRCWQSLSAMLNAVSVRCCCSIKIWI